MSEDAERGDLGEWCSKHREWTHPDAPCWGCQKEAGAIAKVERLEARIRELEAVVEGVLSLGSATLSRISGGTRLWFAARAALKGDADAVFTAPSK